MRLRLQVAVAAAVGLLSFADAQANYSNLTGQLSACGNEKFMDPVCFPSFQATVGGLFTFSPLGFNPSDPSRGFPDWDPGSVFERYGFGYKFAALQSSNCTCGMRLPLDYQPGDPADCNVPCGGDASQTCSGVEQAQIYLEPSFAANDQVPITDSNPAITAYYHHLGCYEVQYCTSFWHDQCQWDCALSLLYRCVACGAAADNISCGGTDSLIVYSSNVGGILPGARCPASSGFARVRMRSFDYIDADNYNNDDIDIEHTQHRSVRLEHHHRHHCYHYNYHHQYQHRALDIELDDDNHHYLHLK
ncbi:hypothetical protein N657DRAFT_632809 [Parathielavia appendiculata]|uniref:WSC domain-containing protein n=1 Tax=Parathielavia appendiculata TaxID=2587402 RepID=A0AAN6Z5G2_9PEZI|nr:hypothetical protein N657DRAFT_632809 [Parathielavia appendiculata]